MSDGLFRKNSLDKIFSPEEVSNYIKTTNFSVWVIFAVAALLLVGGVVWAVFGTIDISVGSVAVCENGTAICYISENDIDEISDSAYVRINDEKYALTDISNLPILVKNLLSPYGLHLADFDESEWAYTSSLNTSLQDGVYKAEIVTESVSPISLLMN